jgi:hypothetical protein
MQVKINLNSKNEKVEDYKSKKNFKWLDNYIGSHTFSAITSATKAQYQVERVLLLDVVVADRVFALQLVALEQQAKLVRLSAFWKPHLYTWVIMEHGLDVVNGVGRHQSECEGLAI